MMMREGDLLGNVLTTASRSIGKGIFLFYVVGGIAIGFVYLQQTSHSDVEQQIPREWGFAAKSKAREAVLLELADKFEQARDCYQQAIDLLIKDDKGAFINIQNKSGEWLGGYTDLLVRLSRIQQILGEDEDAKQALKAAYQIPYGTPDLKSVNAVKLGQYADGEGDLQAAENYFVESIKLSARDDRTIYKFEHNDEKNAVLIPENASTSIQLYDACIELGKFYAKHKRLTEALEIFLATLRSIQEKRQPTGRETNRKADPACYESRIMSYISEVVWASGRSQEAVSWAEGSYVQALPQSSSTVECGICAQMALENASKMYKVGDPNRTEGRIETVCISY